MKNKTILILSVVMVITTLTGCQPEVTPKPDPVKVYLTGTESFTRVDAAGTLATTAIYQWDTNADGTVDSPTAYYTGDAVSVVFDATYGTEWTITVGGKTYLNDKNIGPTFVHQPSDGSDFHFDVETDAVWIADGTVLGHYKFSDYSFAYQGSGTITLINGLGELNTWKR